MIFYMTKNCTIILAHLIRLVLVSVHVSMIIKIMFLLIAIQTLF